MFIEPLYLLYVTPACLETTLYNYIINFEHNPFYWVDGSKWLKRWYLYVCCTRKDEGHNSCKRLVIVIPNIWIGRHQRRKMTTSTEIVIHPSVYGQQQGPVRARAVVRPGKHDHQKKRTPQPTEMWLGAAHLQWGASIQQQ